MAKYATVADLDEDLKRGLETTLEPDERFLGGTTCTDAFRSSRQTRLILTNWRLFEFDPKQQKPQTIINRDEITDVVYSTGFITQKLTIFGSGGFSKEWDLDHTGADEFVEAIRSQSQYSVYNTSNSTAKDDLGNLEISINSSSTSGSSHGRNMRTNRTTTPSAQRSVFDLSQSELTSRLQGMDNYDFEHFVADLWERMGWSAQVSQQSNDAGIDVIAEKKTPYPQKAVIQAKRYSDSTTVGGPKIQQYASLKQQVPGADSTIVVTTSSFTSSAEERAKQLNVKTVDGQGLAAMVDELDARDLVSEYLDIPMEVQTEPESSNREAPIAFEETSDHESGAHLSQTNRDEFGGTTANLSSESDQFLGGDKSNERTESANDQYSEGIDLANDSEIGKHDAEEAGNWHYGIIGISLILIGAVAGNASALSGFLLLLLPIVMYVDIRKVRNVSNWEPRAWLYVVSGFVLFFISVPVYLYFRNKSVGL